MISDKDLILQCLCIIATRNGSPTNHSPYTEYVSVYDICTLTSFRIINPSPRGQHICLNDKYSLSCPKSYNRNYTNYNFDEQQCSFIFFLMITVCTALVCMDIHKSLSRPRLLKIGQGTSNYDS